MYYVCKVGAKTITLIAKHIILGVIRLNIFQQLSLAIDKGLQPTKLVWLVWICKKLEGFLESKVVGILKLIECKTLKCRVWIVRLRMYLYIVYTVIYESTLQQILYIHTQWQSRAYFAGTPFTNTHTKCDEGFIIFVHLWHTCSKPIQGRLDKMSPPILPMVRFAHLSF